jgi:hypothetical protein
LRLERGEKRYRRGYREREEGTEKRECRIGYGMDGVTYPLEFSDTLIYH